MVRTFFIAVFAVVMALSSAPPAFAADGRVALVIGNGAYTHAAKLPKPPNDAADFASVLRGIGFEVVEGRKLDNANLAIFFYADHAPASNTSAPRAP